MSIYIHFQGTIDFLFLSIDFIMESNSSFINDGSEYKYYVGKVKRPEGWKKLRNKVLESLNKTTIDISNVVSSRRSRLNEGKDFFPLV